MIPVWQLYGEDGAFPDLLHVERIVDRAAGLDWTIRAHRHLHLHQLFLLSSGEAHMTIDGEEWRISPLSFVSVPRGAAHAFLFSAGAEGWVVTLPAGDFPELFGPEAETRAPLKEAMRLTAGEGVVARFAALAAIYASPGPFRRIRLRAAAAALLCEALEGVAGLAAGQAALDPRVARFMALAQENIRVRLGVELYARELGMSLRNLSRLCRAATGLSAQKYLESLMIREACRLLAYTRMSVEQIAFHLGFDDSSYFSRAFRRNAQLSPSAYRHKLET